MHHAAGASEVSVSEVSESATESTEAAVSVHNEEPQQQAVTVAIDKHQVSVGLCALVVPASICPACIATVRLTDTVTRVAHLSSQFIH